MSSTVFETWDSGRWASEVGKRLTDLPDANRQALELLYRQGLTHEESALKMGRSPVDIVVLSVVGVRVLQEHLQRDHATIEPPWPRSGTGVPGAPIPKNRAVIEAIKQLGAANGG